MKKFGTNGWTKFLFALILLLSSFSDMVLLNVRAEETDASESPTDVEVVDEVETEETTASIDTIESESVFSLLVIYENQLSDEEKNQISEEYLIKLGALVQLFASPFLALNATAPSNIGAELDGDYIHVENLQLKQRKTGTAPFDTTQYNITCLTQLMMVYGGMRIWHIRDCDCRMRNDVEAFQTR